MKSKIWYRVKGREAWSYAVKRMPLKELLLIYIAKGYEVTSSNPQVQLMRKMITETEKWTTDDRDTTLAILHENIETELEIDKEDLVNNYECD